MKRLIEKTKDAMLKGQITLMSNLNSKQGDGATSFLIGIVIAVAAAAILISLFKPAFQEIVNSVVTRLKGFINAN